MNIRYLRESHLSQLKANMEANLPRYSETEPWLDNLFSAEEYSMPSNLVVTDFQLIPGRDAQNDLKNVEVLHRALRHLNLTQASQEQLWAYLAHVTFWSYMQTRWPAGPVDQESLDDNDKKDPLVVVKNRYFFSGGKAVVRQGIARLWWYGYATWDPHYGYELTQVLLQNQDIALNLMERSFSRNPALIRAVLTVLKEEGANDERWFKREFYRDLMKHINNWGGVTVLDMLDYNDIRDILLRRMDKLTSTK